MKGRLPRLRSDKNACESPHLVIVGAGASLAACPEGDANGRRLPVMADLVEKTGIAEDLRAADVAYSPGQNFEDVYQYLLSHDSHADVARLVEEKVRNYFETIRLPAHVTLYDRLLVSLRPKDVIASFNWDPLLVQAYKRNRALRELPQILFLHGNVDVGICDLHRAKGFLEHDCNECDKPLQPVRLLYPISTKNYDHDPFIRGEWAELRTTLEEAYILTIIGYAAPASDVEAKDIMLRAWKANLSRELAEIDIVDIKSESELEETWAPFFVRSHYGMSKAPAWLFQHARRSCDHFAMASLQQRPCHANPLLMTDNLAELHSWAAPLIAEEIALRNDGTPFRC